MVLRSDIEKLSVKIAKLSNEELKDLWNDKLDEKYDKLIEEETEQIAILEQERQLLLVSIRSLAEFNLAEQETFESDRAKLLGLLSDSNRLKQQIKEKSDQLKELASKTSLESTSKIVSAAAAEVEEQSERIAQAFLNREIDYLEFDSSYVPKRKLAHSRRYKADRLKLETIET